MYKRQDECMRREIFSKHLNSTIPFLDLALFYRLTCKEYHRFLENIYKKLTVNEPYTNFVNTQTVILTPAYLPLRTNFPLGKFV